MKNIPLPVVDPNADDYLEQLFAWGDAFVKRYGLSDDDVTRAEDRAKAVLDAIGRRGNLVRKSTGLTWAETEAVIREERARLLSDGEC